LRQLIEFFRFRQHGKYFQLYGNGRYQPREHGNDRLRRYGRRPE
jgi:hypothetical protein